MISPRSRSLRNNTPMESALVQLLGLGLGYAGWGRVPSVSGTFPSTAPDPTPPPPALGEKAVRGKGGVEGQGARDNSGRRNRRGARGWRQSVGVGTEGGGGKGQEGSMGEGLARGGRLLPSVSAAFPYKPPDPPPLRSAHVDGIDGPWSRMGRTLAATQPRSAVSSSGRISAVWTRRGAAETGILNRQKKKSGKIIRTEIHNVEKPTILEFEERHLAKTLRLI